MEDTLFTILGAAAITLGTNIVQIQATPQAEWEYSKLIAEVKKHPSSIAMITINSDRTHAEVTIANAPANQKSPQKVRVKLANDPNFIKTLSENNIEIRVAPPRPN